MSHPCEGLHPCDHCFLCDVVGVCCMSVSAEQRAQLEAKARAQLDQLRQAIVCEADTTFSLAELMQIEAERQVIGAPPLGSGWPLPAAQRLGLGAAADVFLSHSRKEAVHVLAARRAR